MYRYLGQYIDRSSFDNQYFPIVAILYDIDSSTTSIVSISMSQPITSMAPSAGDSNIIDDVLVADP
jgi:hypothetical protein